MRSLFLLALPALFGCPVQGTVCTLDYRSSVTVYVYDQANAPLEQAEVSYRVDDGDWAACEHLSVASPDNAKRAVYTHAILCRLQTTSHFKKSHSTPDLGATNTHGKQILHDLSALQAGSQ